MDISQITDRLFVGTTPRRPDLERLDKLGVRLIINMRFCRGGLPGRLPRQMRYVRLRTFDSPLFPIPMSALIQGARAALPVIDAAGCVYVHCSRGRHRSVAMAAAILIAQGHPAQAAMNLIKARRAAADPEAPHIRSRIMAFSRSWPENQRLRR